MKLFEMKQEHKAALDTAEAMLGGTNHVMTATETAAYDASMNRAKAIESQIKARERMSTIRTVFPSGMPGLGLDAGASFEGVGFAQPACLPALSSETSNPEYAKSLVSFLRTGGKAHGDDLTAGADGQGGYHIPGSELYTRQRNANGSVPRMQSATYEGAGGGSDAAGGYAVSIPTETLIVPSGYARPWHL